MKAKYWSRYPSFSSVHKDKTNLWKNDLKEYFKKGKKGKSEGKEEGKGKEKGRIERTRTANENVCLNIIKNNIKKIHLGVHCDKQSTVLKEEIFICAKQVAFSLIYV